MSNNVMVFKALSSDTRIMILKTLMKKEMHLSGLAREVSVSTPVVSRHVKILEEAGLIRKQVVGNIYLLSANIGGLEKMFEPFVEESKVEINRHGSLFDALKQLPGIEIQRVGSNQYITSIDGEKGYYIYEVDGIPPRVSIDKYKPEKNVTLHLKKLVLVSRKKIEVKISRKNKSK